MPETFLVGPSLSLVRGIQVSGWVCSLPHPRALKVKARSDSGQTVSKKASSGCWEECSAVSYPVFASLGLNEGKAVPPWTDRHILPDRCTERHLLWASPSPSTR